MNGYHHRRDQWQARDLLRFRLIGADHSTRWRFGAPGSPVRLAAPPEGLQGAPVEHDWQDIVGLDGQLWRGTVDKRATITLKVWVADPRSSAWARRQHSLWRESLRRGKDTCRLVVVSKESGYWWVDCRVESVAEATFFGQLPGMVGEIGETVTLTTDRAFWCRFDEVREFDRDTCKHARMVNLGDQPAWLRWTVTGQHDGVHIGCDGEEQFLPGPGELNKGARERTGGEEFYGWWVDTDEVWPALMTSTGVDMQPEFPDVWWRKPLPPRGAQRGTSVPLTIRPVNPGPDFHVEVAYTPRSGQAW